MIIYNQVVSQMTKLSNKKTKRRVFFILVITFILMGSIISSTVRIWFQVIEKNNEKKFLQKQIAKLEDEESYLRGEVEKLQDPDYVARYAREKYLYSKDGEFTIRIP
jgi:cell division protein DivIC